MFRTRFKKEIVAEFLPPARQGKKTKIIILCDGLPSIPRKQPLAEFLAKKGFWVVYPRYRGTWESEGSFLEVAPDKDISDVIDELPNGLTDIAFGQHFSIPSPHEVYVIGGSFGGTTALMASLDPRVKKVIANCPVVPPKLPPIT
jgi:esterase/lipase